MTKKINVRILTEPIDPTGYQIVCIPKWKYADVELALKIPNAGNVVFASIEMHNGTYSDKAEQFEALSEFGELIAKVWNENFHKFNQTKENED